MTQHLALIGCGAIAATHALSAQSLGKERCEIVALCDAQFERAAEFGQKFAPHAPVFTRIEALLEEVRPDAVIICTPPASHQLLASAALRRGVAVLCEKPLAPGIEAARALGCLAQEHGALLRTSAKFRFCEGVVAARERLESGDLGTVDRVEIAFGAPLDVEHRWLCDPAQSGGGVLMDNGPHAVDLARFLLGEVRFQNVELRFGERLWVEDEASLRLESEAGIKVRIELSWRRNLGQTFLKIIGQRGVLEVRWDGAWMEKAHQRQMLADGYNKNRAFARQLETFLDDLTTPQLAPSAELWRGEDGLRAVEIIAAAYASWNQIKTP